MWLDRFASQHSGGTSPQSNSRPISPLPRRTSGSRGPYLTSKAGGTPKGSSLSLISSDSSSSLLTGPRKGQGSNLRQSTNATDGPDPEEVLASIIGAKDPLEDKPEIRITIEDLGLDFDFGGLSLRALARGDNNRPSGEHAYKPQTVEEFEKERAKFEELHRSIEACDAILSSVETNLTSFRNDLAVVSADIESLQARSTALSVRLENRKAVERHLAPVVDELSIPPYVVSKIVEGHIDEAWVKELSDLDKRATAHKNDAIQSQSKALSDVGPLLEKLIQKAIGRIRDFLVAQIKALRSPHINAQIIQQQNFIKFKELYSFLHKHHPVLGDEICLAYMNTMRWYYVNQFSRYEKALAKLKLHELDKNDVLGHEDTSRKATVLSSSKVSGPPHDAFNLGRRIDLLRTANQTALPSYLAEEDQSTHYLEVPFRNFNLALIDNISAEYSFLASYFSPSLSFATIGRHFNYIFEPTFALGQNMTRSLVAETFDTLGLLLCIRFNQHLAFELQRRKIPAADGYVNGTAMLLWPRLQSVMDSHRESIRALSAALPGRPASAAAARGASAAPHVVTQRFGQLLHGILALSAEAADDEPVVTSLNRLRAEVESFLGKLAQATFGADARKSGRFLYNNYSLILTIISDTNGKLALEQQEHFEALKQKFSEAT
ncbi:hypothetical protein VTK73DRAFT_2879 [Phialemonium thermophilum]|uniref:Uncharacterized protein n=1 Tax=Phialemonium thermophilum TaxID=223376 RepID=A0ABR3X2T6_9PEZI